MPAPIHHTFGPLALRSQVLQAGILQCEPWKWRDGPEREELRRTLRQHFRREVALFDSGRSGLFALLTALKIEPGDEIILQGFTCAVVPNAILAAGGTPVYVDVNPRTLTIDPAKVRAARTRRTRAVICQHTFGIPADTSALRIICDESDIALIEDCAHVIPDTMDDRIGTHADAMLLSFGRDKAISGVSGGAVLTHHAFVAQKLREIEERAPHRNLWTILNAIGYPLRYTAAKMLWPLHLGKLYLHALRLAGLLPPVLTRKEYSGRMADAPHKLPNACAALALGQLHALAQLNEHRRSIARMYAETARELHWEVPRGIFTSPAPQKFPLYVRTADHVRARMKKHEIYLDDGWCGAVVNPRSVDQRAAGYTPGTCPDAEQVAREILSLPTHPTTTPHQAEQVLETLRGILHT